MSLVDVSSLDHRGDQLRCPGCGKYVESLMVLDAGECRCRRCELEAVERADAEVSDWVRPGTRAKRVATRVEAKAVEWMGRRIRREAADGAG